MSCTKSVERQKRVRDWLMANDVGAILLYTGHFQHPSLTSAEILTVADVVQNRLLSKLELHVLVEIMRGLPIKLSITKSCSRFRRSHNVMCPGLNVIHL